MNYPTHICSYRGGIGQIVIFADGTVAEAITGDVDRDKKPPSRLAPLYKLPAPIVHVVSGPADYYLIGWDAEGNAYGITRQEGTRIERFDIGSLEEVLADDAEREAREAAARLEAEKANAERARRELEAEQAQLEAARSRLEEQQAAVRSATTIAGNATKAARAARELAKKKKTTTTTESREAAQ